MKKNRVMLLVGVFLVLVLVGGLSFSKTYQRFSQGNVSADEEVNDTTEEDKPFEENEVEDTQQDDEAQEGQEDDMEEEDKEKDIEPSKDENKGRNNSPSSSNKKVFLTFDDGPTSLTPKVLDILKEYEVNATFFTIGRLLEQYPEYAIRTYKEGNMILPHSYSHDYAIYSTFESFYDDFYKAEEAHRKVLGFDPPPIFRFPGGSSNHSSFDYGGKQFMPKLTEDIKEKGYYYIDWNVNSGDTGPDSNNPDKMLKNVLDGVGNKDFVVILFHDLPRNKAILDILPEVIETLKNKGYAFRTFRDITEDELNKMVELKLANKPIIR